MKDEKSSVQLPKISVAIPTYQREQVLIDTIHDVLNQNFTDFELIVVDQTSQHDDFTVRALCGINDNRFRYFKVAPASLPAARNFAIKKSRSEIILFIDDDVCLTENFITAHYNAHISRPDILAVAGRVTTKGQKPTEELFSFSWDGEELNSFHCPHSQEATSFLGGNFSVKKDVVEKVGMFDTNYCESSMREESDLASRIVKKGYKIWYESEAELLHLIAETGGCRIHEMKRDNQSFYKNDLYFTLRRVRFFLLPIVLTSKLLRYVFAKPIRRIPFRTYIFLRGLMYGIKSSVRPVSINLRVIEKKDPVR